MRGEVELPPGHFPAARLEMEALVLPEHVTVEDVEDVSDEAPPTSTPDHYEIESA